ncbi:MAG: hypothetical protein OEN21_03580 [Myxococcales bacterium]|nr:hypothetical protein [Myxococcales bacterium]
MRYLFGFLCVCALGLVPLVGCGNDATGDGGTAGMGGAGGTGGNVTEAIEQMLVGRWWLDWDGAMAMLDDGVGLPAFTADGWANYDVKFPVGLPGLTDWCRRYANWSLFDVVSETEFGYALTYTHDTCSRETGWTEQFKVVLDQTNPPNGEVTRLSSTDPGVGDEFTMPIERCTTDINATEACTFDTGLGAPTQNPPTVELTLTLVVGASGIDRPPLEGAAFCETDTENCEMTDANGQATIEIDVPADGQISYTYTKDGYASALRTEVVDDTFVGGRTNWTLTDAEMQRQADLVMTPYPYEGTGALVVSVFPRSGATFELVGASGKGFYYDAQGDPSLDLDSTTTNGVGGFVEVAPDEVEVRLGGTATNCVAEFGWPGSEANTIRMPVKVGFVSWSGVVCDAL